MINKFGAFATFNQNYGFVVGAEQMLDLARYSECQE
jgi:hypothetical protein